MLKLIIVRGMRLVNPKLPDLDALLLEELLTACKMLEAVAAATVAYALGDLTMK